MRRTTGVTPNEVGTVYPILTTFKVDNALFLDVPWSIYLSTEQFRS